MFVLSAVQFTHVLDFVIMMPLGPQLMRVFAITPQQFGLLVSAYTISAGISGFAGSFFIDRFDRRSALLITYIGFAVGTLACALSPDYYFFLAARIFAGLFGGILGALIFSIIGDAIPESRRGAATGKVMAAFSVASVVGVPFGLYLTTLITWHAPFIMLAGLSVLVLPVAFKAIPSMRKHFVRKTAETNPFANLQAILGNKNCLRALSLMVMLNIAGFTVIPFLSPYMVANVGLLETQLPYIYLFGGALSFFTSPYIGRLSDRYGKPMLFSWMAILSIFPVLAITNLPVTPLWLVLIITTLFFIMNGGRFVPAVAMVTSSVTPQYRGSFMSLNSSLQSSAAGLASFAAGMIMTQAPDKSLQHFEWTGTVSVVATLLCVVIGREVKPAEVQPNRLVRHPDTEKSQPEQVTSTIA